MTETPTKRTLSPNPDGSVTIPKEWLGNVGPRMGFRIKREGDGFQLEPVPLKLHEISDPEERAEAFDAFMQRFAQKTGVSWPENYNVRDGIYD